MTILKIKICLQHILTFVGSSIEEVNLMFTCANIRFNQSAFLIHVGWLCNLYNSEISLLEVIITLCKLEIQCDNYNMRRSSNTTTLFDCGLQKKRRDHHRNISMLCDEKAPSVWWFLKLAMANKSESRLSCLNIQINISKSSLPFFFYEICPTCLSK